MKARPIVQLRRAYYHAAVKASECPACGATRGQGCISGPGEGCMGSNCTGYDRCQFSNRIHQARQRAWTHVASPSPSVPPGDDAR